MSKKSSSLISLLFVCFGNICRSPTFEAIINHLAEERKQKGQVIAASRGLDATFVGATAHKRMQHIAAQHGIQLEGHAQLFEKSDFVHFDAIFGVNKEVVKRLTSYATAEEERAKIFLATHFSSKYRDEDIPDPYYYGQMSSFEAVWEMIEDAAKGIYRHFVPS